MAILIGSYTLILVIAAKTFDNRRELHKLSVDQESLQTVLNKANSVIEDLNAYLLEDFKRRKDLKFEVKPSLAQLLVDVVDANKLAEQVAGRLVKDPRFTIDKLSPVNVPLTPLRNAFQAPALIGLNFGYATLAPRELRDLTFTELIVFSRFTRLHPQNWIEPLTKVAVAPNETLPDETARLAALLAENPNRPADIGENDPPRLLYQALLQRERASRLQVGTSDSTYAETLAATAQIRSQIRTAIEQQAGFYTLSVPQVGVDVTAGFLMVAAPLVLLVTFFTVLMSLLRAMKALRAIETPDLGDLEVDWSYEPLLPGVARGPTQAIIFFQDLMLWSGGSFALLVYLQLLYGGTQISGPVTFFAGLLGFGVHIAAYCLGRQIVRLPRVLK
jgi:hypothetical protein